MKKILGATFSLLLAALACGGPADLTATATPTPRTRLASLPPDVSKVLPADDALPPVASAGWAKPVPLDAPINTAGGEDGPFITPDGQTLYFFFTPDVRLPAEQQLFDGVTGLWAAQQLDGQWSEPERLVLASPGEAHLDGCPFVLDTLLVFCSARVGNFRDVDLFTATWRAGAWADWQNWGQRLNADYEVGEMHLTADGRTLFFGSSRAGGLGGRDLWMSTWTDAGWGAPVNLGASVNTAGDEDRPFLSADGQALWFDGTSRAGQPGPAIFRALRQPDGAWGPAEEIVSVFAGEPSFTADGRTLYFAHHYFAADSSAMLEADIYVTTHP